MKPLRLFSSSRSSPISRRSIFTFCSERSRRIAFAFEPENYYSKSKLANSEVLGAVFFSSLNPQQGIRFVLVVKARVKSQTSKINDKIVIGLHTRGKNTIVSKIIYFVRGWQECNNKLRPEENINNLIYICISKISQFVFHYFHCLRWCGWLHYFNYSVLPKITGLITFGSL